METIKLTWNRAEVFVLIIMGSIPTLKPLLSQVHRQIPLLGSLAFSKKHTTKENKLTTVGSKTSNGFRHRGHGDVTIALGEIDNMTRQRHGSSTESILVTKGDKPIRSATASPASVSPRHSPPTSPKMQAVDTPVVIASLRRLSSSLRKDRPSRDSSADRRISVQRDFTLGYDEHSLQDTLAFEQSKRP